jgi:hypothetical protein
MARLNVPITVEAKQAKDEIAAFNKELRHVGQVAKLTAQALEDNGQHTEALTVKQEALAEKLRIQKDITAKNREGLEAAGRQTAEYAGKVKAAQEALDAAKNTTGASKTEIGKLEVTLAAASAAYKQTEQRVTDWARAVEKSEATEKSFQASLNKTGHELVGYKNVLSEIGQAAAGYVDQIGNAAIQTNIFGDALKANIVGDMITGALQSAKSAIIGYMEATALAMDRIDKQSQAMGISRQRFQEWDYQAQQNGATVDSLAYGMRRLQNAMADVDGEGGKVGKALKEVGLDFEKLTALSPEDALDATVKAFNALPEGPRKAALAFDIFGRQGQALMPLLNQTAGEMDRLRIRAHELGAVMGDDIVDAGVDMANTLTDLRTSLGGLANSIGAEALPAIKNIIDSIIQSVEANRGNLQAMFGVLQGIITFIIENKTVVIGALSGIGVAMASIRINDAVMGMQAWIAQVQSGVAVKAAATAASGNLAAATASETAANIAQIPAVAGSTAAVTAKTSAVKLLTAAMSTNPLFVGAAAGAAIFFIARLINNATDEIERQTQRVRELSEEFKRLESKANETERQLQNIVRRIDELHGKDTLTFIEQEELAALEQANVQLERKLQTERQLANIEAARLERETISTLTQGENRGNSKSNQLIRDIELYNELIALIDEADSKQTVITTRDYKAAARLMNLAHEIGNDISLITEQLLQDILEAGKELMELDGHLIGVSEGYERAKQEVGEAIGVFQGFIDVQDSIARNAQYVANAVSGSTAAVTRQATAAETAAQALHTLIQSYQQGETAACDYVRALQAQLAETQALAETNPELAESLDRIAGAIRQQLANAPEYLQTLRQETTALTREVDMLRGALDESNAVAGLSNATALRLIDAGYAAALSIDRETGAVRLNIEAYTRLMEAKLDAQQMELVLSRTELYNRLDRERQAIHDVAHATYDLASARLEAIRTAQLAEGATRAELAALEQQINIIDRLRANLGNPLSADRPAGRSGTDNDAARAAREAEREAERAAQEAERAAEAARKSQLDAWTAYYKDREDLTRRHIDRERFYNRLPLEDEIAHADEMLAFLRQTQLEIETLEIATAEERVRIRRDLADTIERYERQAHTAAIKMAEEAHRDAEKTETRTEKLLRREIEAAETAAQKFEAYAALRLATEQRLHDTLARINDKYWLNEKQKLDEITAAYERFDNDAWSIDRSVLNLQNRQEEELHRAEQRSLDERRRAQEKYHADRIAVARAAHNDEINLIRARYDAEIEAARQASDAHIALLNDRLREIDALMKAEARAEQDESDADKIKRLRAQVQYETSDTNIHALNKEIARIETDMAKRHRREALDDERETLRSQINLVKDNFNQQRATLQTQRDAEIEANRAALDDLTRRYQAETDLLSKHLVANTAMIKTEENVRQASNRQHLIEVLKQEERHSREKRLLMGRTTDQILSDFNARIAAFAAVGRSHGNAYVDAFNAAMARLNFGSGMGGIGFGLPGGGTGLPPIHVEQTFNTPMVTPAQAAREVQYTLEDILRHR